MKIYIHRDTNIATANLGDTSPLQKLTATRGDTLHLDCVFHDGTDPVELASDVAGVFVVKEDKKYTDPALFAAPSWVKAQAAADGYLFTTKPTGAALDALLVGKETATLMCEVTWDENGETHTTQKIALVITPDIWRDNEPEIEAPAEAYPLPALLALKGDLAALGAKRHTVPDLFGADHTGWKVGDLARQVAAPQTAVMTCSDIPPYDLPGSITLSFSDLPEGVTFTGVLGTVEGPKDAATFAAEYAALALAPENVGQCYAATVDGTTVTVNWLTSCDVGGDYVTDMGSMPPHWSWLGETNCIEISFIITLTDQTGASVGVIFYGSSPISAQGIAFSLADAINTSEFASIISAVAVESQVNVTILDGVDHEMHVAGYGLADPVITPGIMAIEAFVADLTKLDQDAGYFIIPQPSAI